MRIEKWKFEDKEIEVPILDDEEIEKNDDEILDKTQPIDINEIEDANEQSNVDGTIFEYN